MSSPRSKESLGRLRIVHLRLLVALVDLRSIHRASAYLGMTQPAVSKLLREIEAAFEVELFQRNPRGVLANACGAALVRRARVILGTLDGAREELRAVQRGAAVLLKVGVTAAAAAVLVPRSVCLLRLRDPHVCVNIEEGKSEWLLEALRGGQFNCLVGRLTAPEHELRDLVVEPLYPETMVVVCGMQHPFARRRTLTWQEVGAEQWIAPPASAPLLLGIFENLFQHHQMLPKTMVQSVSILANVTLLGETNALALMPEGIARHYARMKAMAILRLPAIAPTPWVSVIGRKGGDLSAQMTTFLECLRAVSRPLAAAEATAADRRSAHRIGG